MEEFWARVNWLIRKANITQEVLAETIGVSKNTLYSWIANNTLPRADAAYRIASAFGVSVEYLITGAESVGKPDTAPIIVHLEAALDGLKRL
jgi:transcriptional regulator with XRE-family HTH domain